LTFLILLGFWLVFSGRFDAFHVAMGVVSSALVSLLCADLLFPAVPDRRLPGCWLRFAAYIPWLLYQVLRAGLHVLYLTFHPRLLEVIDPRMIEFESRLTGDLARTTFANSITLTPGTITVNVTVLGRFVVHCIDAPSAQGLPGAMEDKIAKVFSE
jgi:multicomponent Na+:H+ antiporter subunit E